MFVLRNKIVRSERELKEKRKEKKSQHQLPQPFDPRRSQLFSITFKLLFTRSQRVGLRV